jgi:hypothetical protein
MYNDENHYTNPPNYLSRIDDIDEFVHELLRLDEPVYEHEAPIWEEQKIT